MDDIMQLTDERLPKLRLLQEELQSSPNGKLYVWGAAAKARVITSYITNNSSLSVTAYVVHDNYFFEETFLGKPVLKASDFLKSVTENDRVILNNQTYGREKGMQEEMPSVKFVYLPIPTSVHADGTWLDRDFYQRHKERFEGTRNLLADDISKQTMDAFIKACITGNTEELDSLYAKGQYFNELVDSCKSGCFVDCGAYTGDTVESAIDFLGDRIEGVIAFEPNLNNMIKLKEQMKKIAGGRKLKLLQKGTYDKSTMLRFSSSEGTSSFTAVSEDGNMTIETDSIDNAASDMGEISFIKMDIEGSELKGLLGAAETIRKYHPILTICAYHKPEDLFELPETIRKITNDSGYKYYLRYHAEALIELVLYAIPVD